ncbi:hypothetical protein FQR65_LT05464 [Abscondita terminalis]|nr:hypothetical protein FQR65_LT05464 [Abscondita terminalis]
MGDDGNRRNCEWFDDCFRRIPKRLVLYLLSLSGIAVGYLMRLAINLTILAMVKEKPVNHLNVNFNKTLCYINDNGTRAESIDYRGTLDWSLDAQYYVLSSYYWAYLLAHLFSGYCVQKYGTKKIFGWCSFISSLCILCIPFTSHIHYVLVVVVQSLHGFVQGFTWSSIYAVTAVWIPINEKSRFVTSFQGSQIGMIVAYLFSSFIISRFGWSYVFYFIGTLGILTSLAWYLLMCDKPEQHPRISKQELLYIQQNRAQTHSEKAVPWISILTSIPVWAIAITSFGRTWLSMTLQVYGPQYLKTVVGLTLEMNGLWMGGSAFISFLTAIIFSTISDLIVTHKWMSLESNRKLFSAIGQILPAILVLALCHINCNVSLIATIWIFTEVCLTANFPGAVTNIVDIAPNFSAPVSSFVQTILLLSIVFSTLTIKSLLQIEDQAFLVWRKFFYISCGIVVGTYIGYAIFGSAKIQEWDNAKTSLTLNDRKVNKDY